MSESQAALPSDVAAKRFHGKHFRLTVWVTPTNDGPISWDPSWMSCLVYQQELCPDTNRLHWQTHLSVIDKTRFGPLLVKLGSPGGNRLWLSGAKYPEEHIKYCMKDESRVPFTCPIVFGDLPPKKGERCDLKRVHALIVDKVPLKDIVAAEPGACIRYFNNIRSIIALQMEPRGVGVQFKTKCHIYWGDTRTGKSYQAKGKYPPEELYDVSLPSDITKQQWWCNYTQQKCVLVDEFQGKNHWPLEVFKKITDDGQFQVQPKGMTLVQFNSELIIFTSQHNPRKWWTWRSQADYDAFAERVDVCERFTGEPFKFDAVVRTTWELKGWKLGYADTFADVAACYACRPHDFD